MTTEIVKQAGPENRINLPTLSSFRYPTAEAERIRTNEKRFRTLGKNVESIANSSTRLEKETDKRLERLSKTSGEIVSQAWDLNSSVTCSAVYLKMLEDDNLKHLSPEERLDFFNLCLQLNMKRTINPNLYSNDVLAMEGILINKQNLFERNSQQDINRKINDRIGNPPKWFNKDRREWTTFASNYTDFVLYLNPSFSENSKLREIDLDVLGLTSEFGLPDSLTDNNSRIPTREEVEEERKEDLEQLGVLSKQYNKISKQRRYLSDRQTHKKEQADKRIDEESQGTFLYNFADIITAFKATAGIIGVNEKNEILSQAEYLELRIKKILESQILLGSKEIVALFLEEKLREGKVIGNAQEIVGDHFVSLFMTAFAADQLNAMRETDKKGFRFVNYTLKPLMEILAKEDIEYLKEVLETYKEKKNIPIEEFILDLGEVISKKLKHNPDSPIAKEINKFAGSFLRTRWEWAYDIVQKSLSPKTLQAPSDIRPEETVAAVPAQSETDSEIEALQKGNLDGWRIFYSANKSLAEEDLKEIAGEDLEEREEGLSAFLAKEQISSSIKPRSVINALEWLVTIPEEIEQVRMRKEVNGAEFKKIKRGKVRIFYVMDSVKKTLVFFLHQKQATGYGF